MSKIHVLLKKEELNKKKLENKLVVVFDVLLATSTITTVLEHGAKEVIPVLNAKDAIKESVGREDGSYILVGEYLGRTIDGFYSPFPRMLIDNIKETVILSTTNGTVAIKNAVGAKHIFIASLLNSLSVAQRILDEYKDETILLVCSGSSGEFNVEDFYGAGYFIECLVMNTTINWELTDSAYAAHQFYQGVIDRVQEILINSRVGGKISQKGFVDEIEFVSHHDLYSTVPYVKDDKYIVLDKNQKNERGKVNELYRS